MITALSCATHCDSTVLYHNVACSSYEISKTDCVHIGFCFDDVARVGAFAAFLPTLQHVDMSF